MAVTLMDGASVLETSGDGASSSKIVHGSVLSSG
jgi:hypothetical protein